MRPEDKIKLFGMQNLLLEAELTSLEEGGIDIGHAQAIKKDDMVDTEVFEIDIRRQARHMTYLYYLLFCLENSLRKLLGDRLRESYGAAWWDTKVPAPVQTKVSARQKDEQDTPFSERSDEPIVYSDFRDLIAIIESNWSEFSDTFRSIESVKSTLETLNILRRPIAHNSFMGEDEVERFRLHIKDWIRIQM